MPGKFIRVVVAIALSTVLSGAWSISADADDAPRADLAVSVGELIFGTSIAYIAYITNNGPDTAVAVMFNAHPLGDLAPGETREWELAFLTRDMCESGVAAVSSSTADPDLSNNQQEWGISCEPCELDPLLLEIPDDFAVAEGSEVVVDAVALGSEEFCWVADPPYWSQTAGAQVLPQDPYFAEDLTFTAPDGPTTVTLVLHYDGHTRTLNITVLDSMPVFDRFLSPLPTTPSRKSGGVISVKFLLTDSSGSPITSTVGSLRASLTPGTTGAPCAWASAAAAFQCNLKTPKGLGAHNPYTITVLYDDVQLPGATAAISFKK